MTRARRASRDSPVGGGRQGTTVVPLIRLASRSANASWKSPSGPGTAACTAHRTTSASYLPSVREPALEALAVRDRDIPIDGSCVESSDELNCFAACLCEGDRPRHEEFVVGGLAGDVIAGALRNGTYVPKPVVSRRTGSTLPVRTS